MQTIPHRKRIAELLAIFAGKEEIASIGFQGETFEPGAHSVERENRW
jgi:hypothetical protein